MSNNILWTGADIASAVNGQWITGIQEEVFASGVCYYPQQICKGDLVFAINPKTWGNGYKKHVISLEQLANSGAAALIIDREHLSSFFHSTNTPLLLVENTRKALDELGIAARKRFNGKVVCVTGSVGKSSVKEGLRQALVLQSPTYGSRKNFNHGPGVPLSLAQTPPELSYAVYEFSMDLPHITLHKAKIARPNVAIITNIHPDHLLHYPTVEAVADQKSLLFDGCESDGVAVLNHDDPLFKRLRKNAVQKNIRQILTFGESLNSDIRLINYQLNELQSFVTCSIHGIKYEYIMGLPGKHMVMNSLAILAGLFAVGADINRAISTLANLQPIQSHLVYHKVDYGQGFFHLIDDTYNANVASINAALDYLSVIKAQPSGRRIAVLGELSELGESSQRVHESLAGAIINANIDIVYTVGEDMKYLRKKLPKEMLGAHAEIGLDLIEVLKNEIHIGDTILLTGTRTKSLNAKEHLVHVADALKSLTNGRDAEAHLNNQNHRFIKIAPRRSTLSQQSSIVFVGDTSFGENYQEKIKAEGGENLLEQKGYAYALQKMKNFLSDADVVIANLETPLTNLKCSPFQGMKKYIHWGDVDNTPKTLLDHKINAVSLANNHIFDYGSKGFQQTLDTLDKYNMSYFGAGSDERDAASPLIVQVGSGPTKTTLAIFGAFEERKTYRTKYNFYASAENMGVQSLNIRVIKKSIQAVKKNYPEAFIIIFPHWGENYQQQANDEQAQLAEELINIGANLILGHGPHLLQGITNKNNCWIVYSLGNFMFNSPGRYARMNVLPFSMVSKIVIDHQTNNITMRLYPIVTDNKLTGYQSRFVDASEFDQVCNVLEDKFVAEGIKSHDEHGHFLELPIHRKSADKIWFNDIHSSLDLPKTHKDLIVKNVWQSLQQRKHVTQNLSELLKDKREPRIVFISISDARSSAKVVYGTGEGLISALDDALTKLFAKLLANEQINWLKIDIVQEVRDLKEDTSFVWERSLYGVATNSQEKKALLPELLVMNKKIDEESQRYIFKSLSLFTKGQEVVQLYRGNCADTHITSNTLLTAACQAGQYLANAVNANGSFTYIYWPKRDKVPHEYNILRHAGSAYSMLELYQITKDSFLLDAAKKALNYLQDQIHYFELNGVQVACVVEEGCIKLGGNGLAILAFAKYMELTHDLSLLKPAQQLAKWIQETQLDNGNFAIHKQSYPEQKVIPFLSEYYPGEAMFALLRLYHIDKQTCWVDVAEKGADYIIHIRDKGYSLKQLAHDHWFIYTLNELYRLRPYAHYRDHAFKIADAIIQKQRVKSQYPDWIGSFNNPPRSTPAATRSEGLAAAYMLAKYCDFEEHAKRIFECLVRAITFQLHTQFQPESAMYLKNPVRAMGGFRENLEHFELRIDYTQHNISSLLLLYKILVNEKSIAETVA